MALSATPWINHAPKPYFSQASPSQCLITEWIIRWTHSSDMLNSWYSDFGLRASHWPGQVFLRAAEESIILHIQSSFLLSLLLQVSDLHHGLTEGSLCFLLFPFPSSLILFLIKSLTHLISSWHGLLGKPELVHYASLKVLLILCSVQSQHTHT